MGLGDGGHGGDPPPDSLSSPNPIITHSGDSSVFQSVLPLLSKGICSEAVEWKRAYGRSTKHVHLSPKFVPFSPEEGSSTSLAGVGTLLGLPMLHTFWTDCSDLELYRSTTKDQIQAWLNTLKASNVKEWLIILVEPSGEGKKAKLLPRTSVLDKVKGDFAQKQTERCAGLLLSDPGKTTDSKSVESLNAVCHRIRQLLLASYSKTLTKFEEDMRAQREKRTDGGWNFCHYFLLQEELAFVLDMLQVYDEALVQYDELDALFTQFVLNSHLTDTPKWLLSFQRYGDRWPALTLKALNVLPRIRENIRNSSVSLLDFRNYLFARQALLLIKQGRHNELAQRSLAFLHNCINELAILDVAFPEEGCISSWVFVSCLEILGTLTKEEEFEGERSKEKLVESSKKGKNSKHPHLPTLSNIDFSVHTASLWDYAREKLYELGKLCGLLPKRELKSDHLHKVISLAAGLNSFENDNSVPEKETPIEKLKDALSSKEMFEQNYLELCELAMGTYKHIGRLRSARKVGLSLASYYMEAEEYSKAVVFLSEALYTFRDDKWNILAVDVLFKLANCYQILDDKERYIRTCAQISCSRISEAKRNHFFDEMMNFLSDFDRPIISPAEDTFIIKNLSVETCGKIKGLICDVLINLDLESGLPRPVLANLIQAAILPCDHNPKQVNYSTGGTLIVGQGEKPLKKRGSSERGRRDSTESNPSPSTDGEKTVLQRKESVSILTCEDEDTALAHMENNPAVKMVDLRQQFEQQAGQQQKVGMGKLTCFNPHQSLRRKDSALVQAETQGMLKTEFTEAGKAIDIILNPGINRISLSAKVSSAGTYRLGQISILMKTFELLSPRLGCRYRFSIQKEAPTVNVKSGSLTAGIEQRVEIVLNTGSHPIEDNKTLIIRSSLGLKILSEGNELCSEASYPLEPSPPFTTLSVPLTVKADLGSQKDSTVMEHKLMIKCPWSFEEEKKLSLAFTAPFITSHKLHSAGQRKFVQVLLVGNADVSFKLSDHQLTVQSPNANNIPLVALNPRSQILNLENGQNASYMWEVGALDLEEEIPLRLEFSLKFCPTLAPEEQEIHKYYICLQKFKTQYDVKSKVDPHKGTEFLRVGNMCTMFMEIKRLQKVVKNEKDQMSLMYEVRADQHLWAICGRSSGIVAMDEAEEDQVTLDVMPMMAGYLPLPTVHLSKYVPADPKTGTSNVPKLEPFLPGQVYLRSKGMQVHVLPPPQSAGSGGSGGGSVTGGVSSIGGNSSLPITAEHF